MKKLLMVDSASEAGDDNRRVSAKHTMGEEAEAGTWWLEMLMGPQGAGTLGFVISEGCSLVRELPLARWWSSS